MFKSKWFKIPYTLILYAFAIIGFGLTGAYLAIQFKWTNEKGAVDKNSRVLAQQSNKYNSLEQDSVANYALKIDVLGRIQLLNQFQPKNAQLILNALEKQTPLSEIARMLDLTEFKLKKDKRFQNALNKYYIARYQYTKNKSYLNAFEWMNMSEWETFKVAVAKDKKLIDSASKATGVEARLIVSCLVGEQIRLFNSDREAYKKWIGPLKILSVESQFSLGVTGIKDFTAAKMERTIKDSTSEFYLGKQYENLLDFYTIDSVQERFDRLTSFRNHYYSYLYAAVFIKQMKVQWERKGFPIAHRPEILATLFNVGYPQSKPNANPKVGGSTIKIKEKNYSFGMIAHQFYYSGELLDLFPIEKIKFDSYS